MGKAAKITGVDLHERPQRKLAGKVQLGPWQLQTVTIKAT
jgi:hypothetical protein